MSDKRCDKFPWRISTFLMFAWPLVFAVDEYYDRQNFEKMHQVAERRSVIIREYEQLLAVGAIYCAAFEGREDEQP